MNQTSAAAGTWDPGQYLKFADARARPAEDLIARIPLDAPETIYDLGCGPGTVTALLASRWPEAQITGVDNSAEMLAKARTVLPAAEWVAADIAEWRPRAPADLVFSNAALHWLPDHAAVFPRLMGLLAPGGVLAVQMPRNFDAPSHRLPVEVMAAGPWRDKLASVRRRYESSGPVAAPADYYAILAPHVAELDIWQSEYLHALEGPDAVLEWVRGTALRSVLEFLDPDEAADFLAMVRPKLAAAYPPGAGGRTLMPFRRLFIVARRG